MKYAALRMENRVTDPDETPITLLGAGCVRRVTRVAFACLCLAFLGFHAPGSLADSYPDRGIHVVVPWPAGGLLDFSARTIGEKLHHSLHTPVVVENKLGAAGNIGAAEVAKAQPDGYTLLVSSSAMAMSVSVYRKPLFDVRKDLQAVALIGVVPSVLVINPSLKIHSVSELIAYAKAHPGKLNCANAGYGTPNHLLAEMFKSAAGVKFVDVSYKGAPPAVRAVIAGQVDMSFPNITVGAPMAKSGKVRALAVTSEKRSSLLPDAPTMMEAGMNGFVVQQWMGFFAPPGTPPKIVELLNRQVNKIMQDPAVRKTFAHQGIELQPGGTPEQFSKLVKQTVDKWAKVVKAANVHIE